MLLEEPPTVQPSLMAHQNRTIASASDVRVDGAKFDTEYDRAKVPPYNGNDPRLPLVV